MSDSNVIVLRRLPDHPKESATVRIDARVKLGHFLRGLEAENLVLRHDARTGEFVIVPRRIP